jgi:predicted DNA-binding transcriptional regulator AlpA
MNAKQTLSRIARAHLPRRLRDGAAVAGVPNAPTLPADGFSQWIDLQPFVPFSRETLRQRELKGQFPKRVHLSRRCAVWPNREIHKWFADPLNYRSDA